VNRDNSYAYHIEQAADYIREALKPTEDAVMMDIMDLCHRYSLEYTVGMGTWFFSSLKRDNCKHYDRATIEGMRKRLGREVLDDLFEMAEFLDHVGPYRIQGADLTINYKPKLEDCHG
jgi:hypothetical protein